MTETMRQELVKAAVNGVLDAIAGSTGSVPSTAEVALIDDYSFSVKTGDDTLYFNTMVI